ncbi:hypothetical protein I4U23_004052 [Adineta vaga]|nr:hypothetical protein I4U23_004052 [Adineta vaga]
MQFIPSTIVTISLPLLTALVVAFVVVLSLIPTYLQNNASFPTFNQNTVILSVTYKTNLLNQSSIKIIDRITLNDQLFRLQHLNLSIISYGFTSKDITSKASLKKSIDSIQCADGSSSSNVPLNFRFSLTPTRRQITNYQWEQYLTKLQENIQTNYKQFDITMLSTDNKTVPVQLEFCSLQKLSADATTTLITDKIRLDCPLVILGAGVGGSHSAYRLAPTYKNKLCIFERESYIGGRLYDIDYNGNLVEIYSTNPIIPMGGMRFYEKQPVVKQLVDELNISYYQYDYQTTMIKARGKFYTSYNEMCSKSYTDLVCTDDTNGFNVQDQLWNKLLEEYGKNSFNSYQFADVNAFCRYLLGDEGTDYLKDSFRFRADFLSTDVSSYMEFLKQDFNLNQPIYYPHQGLSEIVKRMISNATNLNNAQLYLNEPVIEINENIDQSFTIKTTNYQIISQQLIIAIPPIGWKDIQGSIANEIKSSKYFQSILPIRTIIIVNFWPNRWWENSLVFGKAVDRAWTRQNCISFIEIISQHPAKKELNATKTVYDDGLCVDMWLTLIARSSQDDLVEELLRGLRGLFIDVEIPRPLKTLTKLWPGAWHFQKSNSNVTNKEIRSWALKPITKYDKYRISLVGEAFDIDRSGWIDGAIKSSLLSLYSQFNFQNICYQNDAAINGNYCTENFIYCSNERIESRACPLSSRIKFDRCRLEREDMDDNV